MRKAKDRLEKIIFHCDVARSRYDYTKRNLFDEKLGIWPFVEKWLQTAVISIDQLILLK